MPRPGAIAVALCAGVLLVVASACSGGGSSADGGAEATVVRVVDGDTLVVEADGIDEKVRLIGIDTPESVKPDSPVECFGPEASDHLRELLPEGTVVRLERDVEARDRYGRLLAYVRRDDGMFVNKEMVADGYAQPVTYPPNVARTDELVAAGRDARAASAGMWSACGGDDAYG